MSVATVAALAAAALLSGCTSGGSTGTGDAPTASSSPSASPTPSPTGAAAIRGDWEAPEAEWVVHFEDDDTFTEDFEGLTDFRVGTYEVDGDVVRLIGDDGNTDEGTVTGSGDDTQIAFNLGTLKRQ